MTALAIVGFLGIGLDIRELDSEIASWGVNWFQLGFILMAVTFILVAGKLIRQLGKYENARPDIEVYPHPHQRVGKELSLIVHNKTKCEVKLSATMTCMALIGDESFGGPVLLTNAPMVWAATGKTDHMIGADGKDVLKLCRCKESSRQGDIVNVIEFFHMELDKIKTAPLWIGKVVPDIFVEVVCYSGLPLRDDSPWRFDIMHIPDSSSMGITYVRRLRRKPLIRKVPRADKSTQSVSE